MDFQVCQEFFQLISEKCEICGLAGTASCTVCKNAYYCSKAHQIEDWNLGHKEWCKYLSQKTSVAPAKKRKTPQTFPEYELVTDIVPLEEVEEDDPEQDPKHEEQERLEETKKVFNANV
jgi:hypothetical protein